MDYIYYILAILVMGLVCIAGVRFATRSQNPDLILQYQARKKAARPLAAGPVTDKEKPFKQANPPPAKSLRERHQEKMLHRTPWGWPGADRGSQQAQPGISDSVRNFTDRLIREKQLTQAGRGNGSIRALLEDRFGPVDRGMKEMPYQKVKRPLLRDPSEMHDQLDNLGGVETHQLRKKLQFLSAMKNSDEQSLGQTNGAKKVEFRYVELKDLKQPWGW